MEWQPIETAPKTDRNSVRYIIITDGICLPSIVQWHPENKQFQDKWGNLRMATPAGWFEASGIRSRLCGKATHWMNIPDQPK